MSPLTIFNTRDEFPCKITFPLLTSHPTNIQTANLKILMFVIKRILPLWIFTTTSTEPGKKVSLSDHQVIRFGGYVQELMYIKIYHNFISSLTKSSYLMVSL